MPMKKYIPIPIVLGSILIALLLIRSRPEAVAEKAEPETPFVKTMMIFPRTVQAAIQSQGIILPERELTILSEVNSKVEWVAPNMEAGSSFRQGDTLIVLDKRDYELALITAESNILNAEVNLEREKAEFELASKEWQRVGDGKGSDLALRKPQMAQAKATLAAAQANLEQAQRNLRRTVYVAPFDGRVRAKNLNAGTTVFSGTAMGIIYATDYFEVRLAIADQDVPFTGLNFDGKLIPEGDQLDVDITPSSGSGDILWQGRITRAEAEIDPITRMLALVARINNINSVLSANTPLAVGQFVEATISGIELNDITVIPRTAVRDERVWVVDQDLRLRNRPVEIIRYEDAFALIGEGFEQGDRLLTSRMSSLVNGQQVKFDTN